MSRDRSLFNLMIGLLVCGGVSAAPPTRPLTAAPPLGPAAAIAASPVQADGATTPAEQPLVSRVEIGGLEQIDEAIVRDAMQLKVGSGYTAQKLQLDVDSIYALGWFYFTRDETGSVISKREDADGNVEIQMRLVENPVVGEILFSGSEQPLAPELVAEQVPWIQIGMPLNTNPDRIEQALGAIERLYRDRFQREVDASLGRPESAVGRFERRPDGTVTVRIKIADEGATGPVRVPVQTAPDPATPTTPTAADPTPDTPDTPATPAPPDTPALATPDAPAPTTPAPAEDGPLFGDERLRVSAVEVSGLTNLREDLVLETVRTKPDQVFDREQLQADINRLYELGWFYFDRDRAALVELGYPVPASRDLASKARPVIDAEQQGVRVIFDMVENPRVSGVRFVGNTLLSAEQLLQELVYFKPGTVLNTNPDKLDRDRDRIEKRYSSQGYLAQVSYGAPDDNVALLTPEPDGSVILTLQVLEMRVDAVEFVWTNRQQTNESVFRSYMDTTPGDYFNVNRISDDLNNIRRLDLLEDIRLLEPEVSAEDPSRLKLVFEVTEKRTGNFSAGGGISSRYGLVGFVDVGENNLWGLAHRASARVEFGGRFNISTSYFWPLLDGHGSEVSARLYNTEDRTGASGIGAFTNRRANFDQVRRGGSLSYSRPILPQLRGTVSYELESVSTQRRGSALPNLPPFPFQDLGSDTTSSVILGLTHDTRDYPVDASSGMYQLGQLEFAGLGGDNTFGKYRLETRHYFPILGGTIEAGRRTRPVWVLATRGIFGFSSGRPPFSQSFFVGGSETLRGYPEDRFFGDRMVLFNLEVRRAITKSLQGVVFIDAGRAWFQGEPMDLFNDLATAVGLGVRVATPIGPIRFDVGFGADGSKTHFSFGQPF